MSERSSSTPSTADWARRYIERFGLALVAIQPGRKFPTGKSWNEPGGYYTDADQAAAFWAQNPNWNMGVVLGPSRLGSLDIDDLPAARHVFSDYLGLDLDELTQHYPTVVGNPARFRILFRIPAGFDLSRHALAWPKRDDPTGKVKFTVLELRSGSVQDVLPPSIHPETGQPYRWMTPPAEDFPEIPDFLLSIWQNWDIFKRDAEGMCPWAPKDKVSPPPSTDSAPRKGDESVIDAFNRAHDLSQMLLNHGYVKRGSRFMYAGSSTKLPGITLLDDGKLFSHHASDPLNTGKAVDAFDVFRLLEHGGDYKAATKAAAQLLGLELPKRQQTRPAPHSTGGAPAGAPPENEGVGESGRLSLEQVLRRFALIHGETKIWDAVEKRIMKRTAFEALVGKAIYKQWVEHKDRRTIAPETVTELQEEASPADKLGILERYIYIYPSKDAWDDKRKEIVSLDALKVAIPGEYDWWLRHPNRRQIDRENLVFDPTQRCDPATHINTFTGLPLKPLDDPDKCDGIFKLLVWLCNGEPEVVQWVIRWLAYPLQNVGAKMDTALMFHSEVHGSGKSLLFADICCRLYGQYASVLGQHQLESQYTDWRSRLLFAVFEEVLSRDQKYSHTGTIKHMITGKTMRVEKKFVSGWEEANHMNCVFLSNEVQPFPLEPHDRRFLVVWPKSPLDPDLQAQVSWELENGGPEAFYHYLLNVDLGDFNRHTKPLMTPEKERLIEFSLPSWDLFHREWQRGALEIPYTSCLTEELYSYYDRYCKRSGEKAMSKNRFISLLSVRETKKNAHYTIGVNKHQNMMFIVGRPPEGVTEMAWLGQCVERFRKAMEAALAA